MSAVLAGRTPAGPGSDKGGGPRPDLVDHLFVLSAFLAPLSLLVVKSFTVYDILVVVLAALLLIGPRRVSGLPVPLAAAAAVFILAALISTFRSSHPVEALTQTAQFAFIWFVQLPVVLTVARSRWTLQRSLVMFVAGSFTSVVLAMWFTRSQGADRILVFYSDNPNRLGYPTAYLLPFVAYFVTECWRSGRRRLAVLVAVVGGYLMFWALAASASRGAAAGTAVAVIVYFAVRLRSGVDMVVARLLATAVIGTVIVLLLIKSGIFPFTLEERIARTFDPAERLSLTNDRESLARAGLSAFRDSPLVGVGLDNFRYIAPRYAGGTTLQVPHNLWLQFLAQVGLVGTLAFLGLVGYWLAQLLRAHLRTEDGTLRDLTWAFVASMAGLMTIFMTIPIMIDRHYWLLLGLGLVAAGWADERRREQSPT